MEITTLVIYPKGTIANRISIMVSAKIYSIFKKVKLKMMWDHEIPYDTLFLGNVELVNNMYFNGKKYLYNPGIDQRLLYNDVTSNEQSDMYLIIETDEEIRHIDMDDKMFVSLRKNIYKTLLKDHLSGNVLGQLNLVDFPKDHFCCIDGNFDTKMTKLEIDPSIFDIRIEEVKSYVRILIYSKASVLINTTNTINEEFVTASKISMEPVVHTDKDLEYNNSNIKNYCNDLYNLGLVINPDMNKISLL